MATEAVYKYLYNQNRPYSANDIVENLHKEYGKAAVQKALDELSGDGRILEKTYGKQKVYCVMQDSAQNSDDIQKEIDCMDREIIQLQDELTALEEKVKNTEFELKNLNSSVTTEQAIEETEKLGVEMEKLRNRMKTLQENSVVISAADKQRIEEEHTKHMREFRKRKRICTDITNSILENYPKKKKDLFEEIGIETDEEVGCNLPK